jgi:HSP20 family protein
MSIHDPFADVARLRQRIERLFDESTPPSGRAQDAGRILRPPVDLFEDDDQLVLKVDLPGIDQEKLDIQITGEELVVRGERPWDAQQQGCVHTERPHGQFHRAFRLGIPVQNDRVSAAYKDGVLTVVLPKAETTKPRKIEVGTN